MEIKVVLPTDKQGRPIPASKSDSYYHPKEGMFVDADGNRVGFSGSVNESATALEDNYESFMVFNSWDGTAAHLAQIGHRFDRLWEAKERDWVAMPIPEAVKQKLLKLRPQRPADNRNSALTQKPTRPNAPIPTRRWTPISGSESSFSSFAMFRICSMPTASAWRPAPSTRGRTRFAWRIPSSSDFPERFMLCDEVGLGKTIEAGLAIRQLVLSGAVRRLLILVPKSVLVQWQEELYEKFVLNMPRYDGDTFYDVFNRETPGAASDNPWDAHPIMLASSHLAKRRERQQQLLAAGDWDLVVVDEAHHARRKDFSEHGPVPPKPSAGIAARPGARPRTLWEKTRGLHAADGDADADRPARGVRSCSSCLGMGGRWGVEGNFLRYFDELRQPFEDVDWPFVLAMLDDYFATGGEWDEQFCRVAEDRLGPVTWDQVRRLHDSSNAEAVIRQLDADGPGLSSADDDAAHAAPTARLPQHPNVAARIPQARPAEGQDSLSRSAAGMDRDEAGGRGALPPDRRVHPRPLPEVRSRAEGTRASS